MSCESRVKITFKHLSSVLMSVSSSLIFSFKLSPKFFRTITLNLFKVLAQSPPCGLTLNPRRIKSSRGISRALLGSTRLAVHRDKPWFISEFVFNRARDTSSTLRVCLSSALLGQLCHQKSGPLTDRDTLHSTPFSNNPRLIITSSDGSHRLDI